MTEREDSEAAVEEVIEAIYLTRPAYDEARALLDSVRYQPLTNEMAMELAGLYIRLAEIDLARLQGPR